MAWDRARACATALRIQLSSLPEPWDGLSGFRTRLRVGLIDQGVGQRLRCRDACGFVPNRLAIGRWVVSPRRGAIPRRMLGEARVLILLYFCHGRPVNSFVWRPAPHRGFAASVPQAL